MNRVFRDSVRRYIGCSVTRPRERLWSLDSFERHAAAAVRSVLRAPAKRLREAPCPWYYSAHAEALTIHFDQWNGSVSAAARRSRLLTDRLAYDDDDDDEYE